jgi:magnesium-dependent phosphatase 1
MERVASVLTGGSVPQLFVFDVDYTLWAAHVDSSHGGPFRRDADDLDVAYDCGGSRIRLFPEVRAILEGLSRAEARIASASRTSTPDDSLDLQTTLDIKKYFESKKLMQIFPGSKTTHFRNLREESGVEYDQMVFFDDEPRNVRLVRNFLFVTQVSP